MKPILVAAVLILHVSVTFADDIAKELVEKAVARDEQVYSGRIKWFDGTEGPNVPAVLRAEPDYPKFQSFSHDDWVVGGKGYGGPNDWGHPAHGWYDGEPVEYVGDKKPILGSSNAKPVTELEDSRRSINVTLPHWAGGFYNRNIKKWAKQFPDQFKFVADDKVNGVAVKIVEVQTVDNTPFGRNSWGGQIRLFIAPQLGYVIPRMEVRTFDGVLRVRYEASEFLEKAPKIWFPMLLKEETGGRTYFVKFLDVQMLNQEIPASDFVPAN